MKQISDTEISQAITSLETISSFLDTSVRERLGELTAYIGSNILGALIPSGTVPASEEDLGLLSIKIEQINSLIETLTSLSECLTTSPPSDTEDTTCSDLITAINNLTNNTTTIRNIVRTELRANNTLIINPINLNINNSRETILVELTTNTNRIISNIYDLSLMLSNINIAVVNLSSEITTIKTAINDIGFKVNQLLIFIDDLRTELKQSAKRIIQIWECIHTPGSTVDSPVCKDFGGNSSEVDLTRVYNDLAVIYTVVDFLAKRLNEIEISLKTEINKINPYTLTETTKLFNKLIEQQTLINTYNQRLLNLQVTANEINERVEDIKNVGTPISGDGDTIIRNTYNEVQNITNNVNNVNNETNNIRNILNTVNNNVNNVNYTTSNTNNIVNDIKNIVNNITNKTENISNIVNNLYQTTNNNSYNGLPGNNNPCNVYLGSGGIPVPCADDIIDLSPILIAIKNFRDELIQSINETITIYDCDSNTVEEYIANGSAFVGVFSYLRSVNKKIDNIQKIICEQETECLPIVIEPTELPIGFIKETQLYITWESTTGSRWHSTFWNINPDIINKLKNNTWQLSDWNNYFSIIIQRGHKATKQFAFLDIKYNQTKDKKIVFYLASVGECNRLFNWVSTKWVLDGIDYKTSSINNIGSFPVYSESYIYSIVLQEYLNGVKTDETYCKVNPNI